MFPWVKWKKYFPLTCINDVVKLFEDMLLSQESNLTFVSILLGLIERKLIKYSDNEENQPDSINDLMDDSYDKRKLFTISTNDFIHVYKDYVTFVNDIPLEKSKYQKFIDRNILKQITDYLFMKLSTGGKQKDVCHSQTIYSLMCDNSLDSFGLAYAVVAISQYLGYNNVRLSLSEDHAWIEYDLKEINNNISEDSNYQKSTADVVWTGKDSVKRCTPIDSGISDRSRLYLQGNCIVCVNKNMTIAAAITTLNPVKSNQSSMNFFTHRNNSNHHSYELACLKRDLLWLCYQFNLLESYPLALINLADLERNYPKIQQKYLTSKESDDCDHYQDLADDNRSYTALFLYKQSITINLNLYNNCHVYPYLSMGNYFFQIEDYMRAMKCWRLAACVISNYNYKSEDWVIYREFFDIATTHVPNMFRQQHKDDDHYSKSSDSDFKKECISDTKSICEKLRDNSDFLLEFLCYFDYICLWEEGSSVPVLHEVWANKFKEVLCRFYEYTRVQLGKNGAPKSILNSKLPIEEVLQFPKSMLEDPFKTEERSDASKSIKYAKQKIKKSITKNPKLSQNSEQIKEFWSAFSNRENQQSLTEILSSKVLNIDFLLNNETKSIYDMNAQLDPSEELELCKATPNHQSQQQQQHKDEENQQIQQKFIDYFAAYKNVKEILNQSNLSSHFKGDLQLNSLEVVLQDISFSTNIDISSDSKLSPNVKQDSQTKCEPTSDCSDNLPLLDVFKSQKMRDISSLLVAPGKLNIPAIKLPLTAQSQVSLKRTGLQSVYGHQNHEFNVCGTVIPPSSRKRFKKDV